VFLYEAGSLQEKGKPKYFLEILDEFLKNPSFVVLLIPVVCFPSSTETRRRWGFFRGVGGEGKAFFFV